MATAAAIEVVASGEAMRTAAIEPSGWRPVRCPADEHPAAVYLGRLAAGSRPTMARALETMARELTGGRLGRDDLPWHRLRYQHTAALRAQLAERFAPATANRMLSALRGVLRESWRLGLVDAESYHAAADVERVKAERLPAGRVLDAGEMRALVGVCADGSPADARDAAILGVLYSTGVRRAELVARDLGDFDPASGALTVRGGKGRKDRVVYVTNGARAALDAWLAVRGEEPGPLFVSIRKGGRVTADRMTPQAIFYLLRRRGDQAGVKRFSPHDLRRSFVSELLDAGADISAVAALAGHASVTTTARYDRRGERARRQAAGLLHFPFRAA